MSGSIYVKYPTFTITNIPAGAFPLLAPNGSAAAPSYSFLSHSNTGMYSDSSGDLFLATLGTQGFELDANQTFTLGSTNTVIGTIYGEDNSISASSLQLKVSTAGSKTDLGGVFNITRSQNNAALQLSGGIGGSSGGVIILTGNSFSTPNIIQMNTAGTPGFGLDANQTFTLGSTNTGIGTVEAGDGGILGTSINLKVSTNGGGADSAGTFALTRSITNGSLVVSAGSGAGNGGRIQMYGSTHATQANKVIINTASNNALILDANQNLTLGSVNSTNHSLNTGLATNASGVGTITNLPTGSSGNPTGYIAININGTLRSIPFW